MKKLLSLLLFLCPIVALGAASAPDRTAPGAQLWLGYEPLAEADREALGESCSRISLAGSRYDSLLVAELTRGIEGLLQITPTVDPRARSGIRFSLDGDPKLLGEEGYRIRGGRNGVRIQAAADAGLLYGMFDLLRMLQCGEWLEGLDRTETPAYDRRLLNHWDDLDGTIERGYAGRSLWKWDELPGRLDPRYAAYARANASIGINGVVLNNVNADPRILRHDYLVKVAALADLFRRYHIRVYLTANFAAPMKPSSTPDVMKAWGGVGDLDTADPRDVRVQAWWREKAAEIYALIPDFGGFLVKANSEGMPGPQDYGCTHADGANLLARALKPYGGIVMWRTFVYNPTIDPDRMKRSYLEFRPLDGAFDDNVILQTKNGPLDFQPSEPVQPLFGAMPRSQMMLELQITQEYTGHATSLVYLLPMWRRVLDFDTCCAGPGSTVSRLTRGEVYPQRIRAIAGVANTGSDANWTGHPFAQANWYAFGRLAWNPDQTVSRITHDWIRSTWQVDGEDLRVIEAMMMPSWECFLRSSSPYGLGLTLDVATHYRANFAGRAGREWQVSREGIGTDRTSHGTGFTGQYFEPNRSCFDDADCCPSMWLLSFHWLPWNHRMPSGRSLREEFFEGLGSTPSLVRQNLERWQSLRGRIDPGRYASVLERLQQEYDDASRFSAEALDFFGAYVDDAIALP